MEEEANLLIVTYGKNENGFPVESLERIPVYVREKSAMRMEFYEALRSGVQIKTVLEMRQEDYELSAHTVDGRKEYATQVEYGGNIYQILRTYRDGKSMVELTCTEGSK